jgi:hypothetical protein
MRRQSRRCRLAFDNAAGPMRVLLLQSEDSPEQGPWSRQHWDLIVDLGKSTPFSEERWARACDCPVLRADAFRHGMADAKHVREIFSAGRGRLIDEQGIDWWDLMSLLVAPYALTLPALLSVAKQISPSAELWATRSGGVADLVAIVLRSSLRTFEPSGLARSAARAMHYAGLVRRFSGAQLTEIFLDKYDSGYRWRSRFASRPRRCAEPVVLLPSAYTNVSRMAADYARLLPAKPFLMVATRRSARQFVALANVQVRDLAAYAKAGLAGAEIAWLTERWTKLRADLCESPELRVLVQAGLLESFPDWIRNGVSARDAWCEVLEHEPVEGVLCGDDSNVYTRLPVLLAARRKIATVNFHHGAFDGRYALKTLPCDLYLAKNEMERDYLVRVCGLPTEKIVIGAPWTANNASRIEPSVIESSAIELHPPAQTSAILFSEPYELSGLRVDEVYRELLPLLCQVARQSGRGVILKLHPFESRSQRRRVVDEVLTPEDRKLVNVIDGPLTSALMEQAWFGITVESTTVVDCLRNRVCCFLCGWLSLSPYEYPQQYARFGVGEVLQNARQLLEIPSRLAEFQKRPPMKLDLSVTVDPAMLERWLTKSHDAGETGPVA